MSAPNRFSSVSRRILLAGLLSLVPLGAVAQDRVLDAPRAAGTVGERYDGYAVVRDQSRAASVAQLVERVNAERRKIYADRAAAERVPIDQIGRVYATQIFKSAPPGTWFLQESGQWIRK